MCPEKHGFGRHSLTDTVQNEVISAHLHAVLQMHVCCKVAHIIQLQEHPLNQYKADTQQMVYGTSIVLSGLFFFFAFKQDST